MVWWVWVVWRWGKGEEAWNAVYCRFETLCTNMHDEDKREREREKEREREREGEGEPFGD